MPNSASGRPGKGPVPPARALRGPLVALAVVVVLGVLAVFWGLGRGAGEESAPAEAERDGASGQEDAADALARRIPGDPLAQGSPEAPVVLIMWEDFQCPFCARFTQETEPVLVDRFVEDGALRLEWRDFPYLGEQSVQAAQAARAAAEQDAFWAYHDALYALDLRPNSGRLTGDVLVGIAEELGLDVERFTARMQSPEVVDAVAADFREGQQLGISGTPTFLVNGRPIVGAQPTDTFVAAIEQAVAEARADG